MTRRDLIRNSSCELLDQDDACLQNIRNGHNVQNCHDTGLQPEQNARAVPRLSSSRSRCVPKCITRGSRFLHLRTNRSSDRRWLFLQKIHGFYKCLYVFDKACPLSYTYAHSNNVLRCPFVRLSWDDHNHH